MQTDIHPYCDQLTALKTGYPLTSATWPYRGLRNRPLEVEYFLRLSSDKFLVFKWSQVQVQFFKCTGNKLCLRAALIKFRFQSYPRMWKFSQFLQVGKTVDTRVGHAIRPPFMHWLVNIWQVSSCWKFMQQLETFFTHNWSWQGFVSSCDVFTCLWMYIAKYSCFQDFSVYSCLVCLLGFWLRNTPLVKVIGNPISNGIVFTSLDL